MASLCASEMLPTPDRKRKELVPNFRGTESETESDFEDTGLSFDSCSVTKLHKTSKVLRSESKYRAQAVVRIDTKPPTVGGPLPTIMKTCDTYSMPSYYYSLPKYEWKQFHFLQPIKSSLKPIISSSATNQNPSLLKKQRIVHQHHQPAERLRLPPIENLSRSLSRPLREPPTWAEIIGTEFPIDPPLPRLMFTRSPTSLLMPLAITTPPKPSSPTEATTSLEDPQVKHKDKCRSKVKPPKSCIKVTAKQRLLEIGGPMKVSTYVATVMSGSIYAFICPNFLPTIR